MCISPVISGRQHFPALLPILLAPELFLPTLPRCSQSLGCATLFLLSFVSVVWLQRFHPSHTEQSNRIPVQMEVEETSKAVRSFLHCSISATCDTECRLLVSRLQQSKQIHFSHSLHATQVGHGCTRGRLNYTGYMSLLRIKTLVFYVTYIVSLCSCVKMCLLLCLVPRQAALATLISQEQQTVFRCGEPFQFKRKWSCEE